MLNKVSKIKYIAVKIANYISENIGYCKDCNKLKKKDDVGLDPLSAASISKEEK